MKRYLILSLIILLAMGAAACDRGRSDSPDEPSLAQGSPESYAANETQQAPEMSEDEQAEEVPIPAGAALYRGVVAAVSGREDGVVLTLEQAYGTDFGAESLTVVLDGDTRADFAQEDLSGGEYIAAYYGRPMGGPMPSEVKAISAVLLPPAGDCVVSGIVVELVPGDAQESGYILLDAAGESETERVVVEHGEWTQLYLNLGDVSPGDCLSVFTDAQRSADEPPRVRAVEMRLLYRG